MFSISLRICLILIFINPSLFVTGSFLHDIKTVDHEVDYQSVQDEIRPVCPANPNHGKYGAIGFDAYGTLLDVTSVPTSRANSLNLPPEFSTLWRQKQLTYSWLRTSMRRYIDFWTVTQDALDYTLDFYNKTLTMQDRTFVLESWYHLQPFPDVKEGLERLNSTNINLYIFSNGTPRMLSKVLKNSGLSSYFKCVVSVDGVKAFKPSPEVYESFEQATFTSRQNTLFVSSNNWDANGAKSYGFSTVWINRDGGIAERFGFPSDYACPDLINLAKFVK